MSITVLQDQIWKKTQELMALRKEQVTLAKSEGLKKVENYQFKDSEGKEHSLSSLFKDHDELVVIHNMGKSCRYCTLWADGLSSTYKHIATRCGFALVSPDSHDVMRDFTSGRDWKFPYYSAHNSSFIADMGFSKKLPNDKISYMPGYTTFIKKEDGIYRVACDVFGPGDYYAPIWHFMDMLHNGQNGWIPS